MSRHATRALLPDDTAAFAAFERDNREAYERFNEPHPNGYYSDAGLLQAFNRLLARQIPERYVTRITTGVDPARWVGKGSLTVHSNPEGRFARLVYQTDHRHWKQGAGAALLTDLLHQAQGMDLPRVEALIAADNLVSLHLLRRAGFTAMDWVAPAQLRRGPIDCLRLGRALRDVDGAVLSRAHMHLPA
ncbi:MAG: GNAT family N-acetyltransferase [Hydrogenophaga sp.]